MYLDEFQRFVSPTIAENLDEARGFGLHLTLAHQYPSQLIEASQKHGQRLYESILENARNKVVFSLSLRDRNLTPLADWLYMGTFDTKEVKHEQYTTKVMAYDEETRTVTTSGSSRGQTRSDTRGVADGSGSAHSAATDGIIDDVSGSPLPSQHWGESTSSVLSESRIASSSESASEAISESLSEVPLLIPVFGQEIVNTQFYSLDEQRFRAEQTIMFQPLRHAVARFVGMRTPVCLRTSDVSSPHVSAPFLEHYQEEQRAQWPFVLSYDEAKQRLEERSQTQHIQSGIEEPTTYKRRVKTHATINHHAAGSDPDKDDPQGA